jgi:hypothetical protein
MQPGIEFTDLLTFQKMTWLFATTRIIYVLEKNV